MVSDCIATRTAPTEAAFDEELKQHRSGYIAYSKTLILISFNGPMHFQGTEYE